MLFNSYVFILAFLPMVLCGYFWLGHFSCRRAQKIWLILSSLFFYGYFNQSYLVIICGSIISNFFISKGIRRCRNKIGAKALLFSGIIFNLGILFYFKYYDFFIENINSVFKTTFMLKHVVLPLGISFFTFQQLSFVIDSYKGETERYTFLDYALFVSFFPQLVAGPIVLHGEIIPQFEDEKNLRANYENLGHGLYIFAIGLCKKVLIADTLGKVVTYGFTAYEALSSLETMIVVLSYTFQIYFDFSGYCDMANGIAKMFNVSLPINFNSPYKAMSIIDFWNRWHMTLTRFLRQYVYFPLGGSKKGRARTYLNIMIVFLLSGLWHGANWTFVLWGAMHGFMNVLTRAGIKIWEKMHVVFQWLVTFVFINLGWLLFRAESVSKAIYMFKRVASLQSFTISSELMGQLGLPELAYFTKLPVLSYLVPRISNFYLWAFLILCLFLVLNFKNCHELAFKPTIWTSVKTSLLMVWCIVSLSGVSVFLYFNF